MATRIYLKLCLCFILLLNVKANASQETVRLLIFSGTKNPIWSISNQVSEAILALAEKQREIGYVQRHHITGYTGFEFNGLIFVGANAIESILLESAPPKLLLPQVINHVLSRITEPGIPDVRLKPQSIQHISSFISSLSSCDGITVGPDTVPVYNPKSDDKGCFISMETDNNCYNYGNDIVTNTFAQPGRGSGHKWDEDNCSSVKDAALRDGLLWNGTILPTRAPAFGHYVAMLIWPETNFHWIRMDAGNFWSHKPGQTPVRDVDDDGKKITDPSKANFSPWTQFCGYFISIPSKVTIN